ncbi:MAG: O-antigen ligase family protein [bacterium]|jgi:hypothetical protein|nr:O-antigen ligase family protein [bacterium]
METFSHSFQRDTTLATALLAVLFFLAPFYPQQTNAGFAFFFQSILYLLFTLVVLRQGWQPVLAAIHVTPLGWPILAGLLWVGIGLFYTPDLYQAKAKLALLLSITLLFFLFQTLTLTIKERGVLLTALAGGGLAAALHAIYSQWIGHGELIESIRTTAIYSETMREEMIRTLEANRAMGNFGNPNHLAGWLVLSLWPLWVLMHHTERQWQRALLGLVALPILYAIYQTYSRSGLVVLLFSVGLATTFALWLQGKTRWLKRLFGAGALLLLIGVPLFLWLVPPSFLGGRLLTTSTLVARLHFFRGGWLIFWDHLWLGVGPEGFEGYYSQFIRPGDLESKYVHNVFLEAMLEGGLVGLALLLWLLVALARHIRNGWRQTRGPIPLAAGGAAVGLLLFSLIDFHNNLLEMYLVPLCLAGNLRPNLRSMPSWLPLKQLGWGIGLVLIGCWLSLVACRYYNKTEASLAYALLLEEKWYDARTCYQRAVWFDRTDADAWNGLARVWQRIPLPEAQEKALDCYRQAIQWLPRSASFRADYANALFRLGYPVEAITAMREAQRLFPSRAAHYEQMAEYYRALGDEASANQETKKAEQLKQAEQERRESEG